MGQEMDKKSLRAFIAVSLPRTIISAMDRLQDDLKAHGLRVRWVRPENIHLTLKFLDDINPEDVAGIIAAVESAARGQKPLILSARAVGVFPGLSRARIIWTGLTGQVNALTKLHHALDTGLAKFGFPAEKRRFKGHLTLGRIKGNTDQKKLSRAITACRDFKSKPFTADKLILFKSDLQASGAVYTKLAGIRL
jgi:2'-5' RNA ligase